jgi:hypothetical protein
MGKDAPAVPNPFQTAAAATGTNVATAVANSYLSHVNQNTPTGSLNYNQSGSYGWTDPTTGQTYSIPTFTATQTLTPQQQAIQGQNEAAQYNLAGMANAQSGKVASLLSTGINYAGAPAAGNAQNLYNLPKAATTYDTGGPIQNSIGDVGNITQSYGPADNFSADRQRVEDSLMARMNPQLQIQQQALQTQLADQGIRYGSQAYADAMDNYNRSANDARWGAIQQAGQEQQRMVGEAQQQAQFQNQAQQQGYEQALGQTGLANQAQAQQYQQNAALATFGNTGLQFQLQQQQEAFNAAQAARNQWMQETYAGRNQPINEITALMSGSQVAQPNFVSTPGAQIPTVDVSGLINQQFNQQNSLYQQQNQNFNSLMGGVLGLGAGALKLSDEREKENITRMGTVFSANADSARDRLPVYQYSYKDDPASTMHVGPMAQDVERQDPKAVRNIGGRKYLDTRRVMGNILRAA